MKQRTKTVLRSDPNPPESVLDLVARNALSTHLANLKIYPPIDEGEWYEWGLGGPALKMAIVPPKLYGGNAGPYRVVSSPDGAWVESNSYYFKRGWTKLKPKTNTDGYHHIQLGGRKGNSFYIHRLVWGLLSGKTLPDCYWGGKLRKEFQVDHINRNNQDNRIENLRLIKEKQNLANRDFGQLPEPEQINMDEIPF